jgi:(R,R)-butanediol dehydrogenase/meso-butanediol dehydrogenase/diacetyl reductase
MRAVRFYGRRDVRMDHVQDLGSPKPGWVRLKVDACGICGTDVEGYVNGPEDREYAGKGILTLGHEGAGTVVEVGEGVRLAVGQRVAVEGHLFCRECFWCLRGDYALCVRLKSLGQGADGGLAEEMLAPEYMCLPYADSLDPHHAALAEPTSVVYRAARRGRLAAGETVVVVGGGTFGLLLQQIARLQGAAKAAVDLVRKGGRTVLLGVTGGSLELPLLPFLLAEKEVIASLSHTYDVDFPEALRLLESGQVLAEPLITDRIGLDQVVSHGFEALLAEPAAHLKVLVVP